MKKDFTRDYVTEAFRLYAAMGKPTYEQVSKTIFESKLAETLDAEPSNAIIRAEKAIEVNSPMLLDIMAVEKTLELLEHGGKVQIANAVKAVYFMEPKSPLRSGDISSRVRYYSQRCPADERTVYRWLKEARLMCATIRGLRVNNLQEKKYRIITGSCQ